MICSRALRWLNVCSVVYTLSLSKALSQKEIREQAHDSNRAGTESRGAWQQETPGPAALFMAKISLQAPLEPCLCAPWFWQIHQGVFLLCRGCRGQWKQLTLDVPGIFLQLHRPAVTSGFIMQQVAWEENGKHEP